MSRLFGEPEPQPQKPLFDVGLVPVEAKVDRACPACGAQFSMSRAVAEVFERCSSCMARGVVAKRLFREAKQ